MQLCKLLLLCIVISSVCFSEVVVSNVSVQQILGTKTVEINYEVSTDNSATVEVSLEVKDGDTILLATTLTGDIGSAIPTGQGKQIIWDAGADWNGNVATLTYTVIADDGATSPIMPIGGDPTATSWEQVNNRWVKNIYADGAITMSDRTTNLMWLYDASMLGTATWHPAKDICSNLTYAGHSDWFLPAIGQISDMYSQKTVFSNVSSFYWSSDPSDYNSDGREYAHGINMSFNSVSIYVTFFDIGVWSCRAGQ